MKRTIINRGLFLVFAVALLFIGVSPVLVAQEYGVSDSGESPAEMDSGMPPDEEVSFTADLVTQGDAPGLYVTWKNVPQELSDVSVFYAFGSPAYLLESRAGKTWYTNPDQFSGDDLSGCQVDENGNVELLCYRADEHPLSAYLSGTVNTLWIQVSYETQGCTGEFFEPIRFSHDDTYDIPDPPPFTADFELGYYSYTVVGHFTDFPPNVAQVNSTYSWDGVNYQYSNPEGFPTRWDLQYLGKEDVAARRRLENQECVQYYDEPLKSFLARQRDSFYLRLEIVTETGDTYYSQPAFMSRKETMPLPEDLLPRLHMGFNWAVNEKRNDHGLSPDDEDYYSKLVTYTFGQMQLTVREDASPEEIRALLPDTVPVRVRFWDKGTHEKYAFGDVKCKVKWKALPALSLTPGQPFILENMAEPLVIPAGTEVVTDIGSYTLSEPLYFQSRYESGELKLILNPVAADEGPQAGLYVGEDWNGNEKMSLAFWQKPSGAVSIQAYAVVNDVYTPLGDLIDRRDINHNQSHALYGYVPLLQPDEFPYKDYLSGSLERFTIALDIVGGVYGGRTVTLPWPQEYDLPEEIFDPSGTEGQENNAGFDNGEGDSTDGGQRPNLPLSPEFPEPVFPPPDNDIADTGIGTDSAGDDNSENNRAVRPPLLSHPDVPSVSTPVDCPSDEIIIPAAQTQSPVREQDRTTPVTISESEPKVSSAGSTRNEQTKNTCQEATQQNKQTVQQGSSPSQEKNTLLSQATAVVMLVGGGIAVMGIPHASNMVSGTVMGRLIAALRRLIFRCR